MAKGQTKQKGGRNKYIPSGRLTKAELDRFNRLRGDMSVSDCIVDMMDIVFLPIYVKLETAIDKEIVFSVTRPGEELINIYFGPNGKNEFTIELMPEDKNAEMKLHSCAKLEKAIERDIVMPVLTNMFFIRGKPRLINDGDGHFDDMTDEHEIFHCPFCGKKLTMAR